jgi:hypothetical protein
MVMMMAVTRRRTINGVPYFCQAGLRREGKRSTGLGTVAGAGEGGVAGTGEDAISVQALLGAVLHIAQESASRFHILGALSPPFMRRANSLNSQG